MRAAVLAAVAMAALVSAPAGLRLEAERKAVDERDAARRRMRLSTASRPTEPAPDPTPAAESRQVRRRRERLEAAHGGR